ncbi:hypothetical protein DC31_14445 [Microbacterium sp. CH12i]|uniref:hypothetical protein n=1 Tax=Microbacterium sp. CH12i TaxID=1479651 RepID=UPI000461CDA9|nr:hypothetical protein [Microbacterium sp. CH12i]KDA05875.1 hypothetical protein DC31_14445 [Microbacterium sp. CH12i]
MTAAYNVVVHESRLPDADIIVVADVSVTTAQRTLTDLILGASRYPEYVVWMQLLAQQMPTLLPHVHEHLSARPRLPGRRAALTVVERLVGENG